VSWTPKKEVSTARNLVPYISFLGIHEDENTHPPEQHDNQPIQPADHDSSNHGKFAFDIKDINRMTYYTSVFVGSNQ